MDSQESVKNEFFDPLSSENHTKKFFQSKNVSGDHPPQSYSQTQEGSESILNSQTPKFPLVKLLLALVFVLTLTLSVTVYAIAYDKVSLGDKDLQRRISHFVIGLPLTPETTRFVVEKSVLAAQQAESYAYEGKFWVEDKSTSQFLSLLADINFPDRFEFDVNGYSRIIKNEDKTDIDFISNMALADYVDLGMIKKGEEYYLNIKSRYITDMVRKLRLEIHSVLGQEVDLPQPESLLGHWIDIGDEVFPKFDSSEATNLLFSPTAVTGFSTLFSEFEHDTSWVFLSGESDSQEDMAEEIFRYMKLEETEYNQKDAYRLIYKPTPESANRVYDNLSEQVGDEPDSRWKTSFKEFYYELIIDKNTYQTLKIKQNMRIETSYVDDEIAYFPPPATPEHELGLELAFSDYNSERQINAPQNTISSLKVGEVIGKYMDAYRRYSYIQNYGERLEQSENDFYQEDILGEISGSEKSKNTPGSGMFDNYLNFLFPQK